MTSNLPFPENHPFRISKERAELD